MNPIYTQMLFLVPKRTTKHPPMAPINRAAQFAPFAALTGFEACIEEEAREVGHRIELDESAKEQVQKKLTYLAENQTERAVSITYFVPDKRKNGGEYFTKIGVVERIETPEHLLYFVDKTKINIDDILSVTLLK